MRLILISVATLLIVGMILLTARFWGLGRAPEAFDHPWFALERPWIVAPWPLADKAPSRSVLWIDVLRSVEGNLYAVPKDPGDPRRKWTDAELAQRGSPLNEVLGRLADRRLILNILSNAENIDLQISDLIGKSGEGRILIQSDYDVVMSSIKRLQPLWLFGSSQADRVRFRSFQSMWILPATPFKGDVYIGPFQQKNVNILSPEVAAEVKRRGKRLIAGPLATKEEIDLALGLGADGVFIDQPELLGLPFSL